MFLAFVWKEIVLPDGARVYVTRRHGSELSFVWTPQLRWLVFPSDEPAPPLSTPWFTRERMRWECPARVARDAAGDAAACSSCCGAPVTHWPYCDQHLSSIMGVCVKESSVAGAGDGVFATRRLPVGWTLPFGGEIITAEVLAMRYGTGCGEYAVKRDDRVYLDARWSRGIGSMINCRCKGHRANGRFDAWSMTEQLHTAGQAARNHAQDCACPYADVCLVLFVVSVGVKEGCELFADYGRDYGAV